MRVHGVCGPKWDIYFPTFHTLIFVTAFIKIFHPLMLKRCHLPRKSKCKAFPLILMFFVTVENRTLANVKWILKIHLIHIFLPDKLTSKQQIFYQPNKKPIIPTTHRVYIGWKRSSYTNKRASNQNNSYFIVAKVRDI